MQRLKIGESYYVEMIRDLMIHFNSGIAGITNQPKIMFEYVFAALKTHQIAAEKAAWSVFGKNLEDILSLVALQNEMVKASLPYAKYVVPFHFTQGHDGLVSLKPIKNPKL